MSGDVVNGIYEVLDGRFRSGRCTNGDMRLEKLYGDCRWAEGPLYVAGLAPGRVERHPQRPDAALGRGHRDRRRLPCARGTQQWQHP